MKNEGAISAINDYLELSVSPQFGLLVAGAWGGGKTYSVRRLVDSHRAAGRRALWVSLYGVSSKADIDRQLFQQLHPILSSPKVRTLGRLLSSVVSASLPLKLGDAEVDLTLPEFNADQIASDPVDQVIVFDDVERSRLAPREVLGYINGYVEGMGLKVIACANETPLLHAADASDYKEQREKVFGAIVRIEPDFDSAFPEFVRLLSPVAYADFASHHVGVFGKIFTEAGHGNLRALRQSLLLFQRVFERLPDKALTSDAFITEFISLYLTCPLPAYQTKVGSPGLQG